MTEPGDRPPALDGVVFDLDGVLTDTAELHYESWLGVAREEGLPFDREVNERLRGVSREDSLRLILGGRVVSPARFAEMLERKNAAYREALGGLTGADVLPGARELVTDARARGLRVAVGSSSRNAPLVLERLGLAVLFDATVDGSDVAVAKPAPDVFLVAAQRLGLEPSRCAVVEDAAAGVDAAHAAGMLAVGIGPARRVGHADVRYETTADVDLDEVLDVAASRSA